MPAIGGGFFKIVPAPLGCEDDVRFQPFTAIDAPSIEHSREGALLRGNTELYGQHAQEIRYHPGAYERVNERQATHRNDNRRAGRPGGWRKRRDATARSGGGAELFRIRVVMGFADEDRGIGRKGEGFLQFAIEIEGHLRRLEALVLQAIVFRLL